MNAVEFIKHHGIEYTRGIIIGCESGLLPKNNNYADLKQIVNAFELVESLGGMAMAKDVFDIEIHEPHYNYDAEKVTRIEQAINLVEQCL